MDYKEAIEIGKRGNNTMNRDEGQYFLTLVFDELLQKSPGRKLTQSGNSKTSTKTSSGDSLIPVLTKSRVVLETSTVSVHLIFWISLMIFYNQISIDLHESISIYRL